MGGVKSPPFLISKEDVTAPNDYKPNNMLKRWDTRNYDIEFVLKIFDSIDIDFDSMDIPKPKVHVKTIRLCKEV